MFRRVPAFAPSRPAPTAFESVARVPFDLISARGRDPRKLAELRESLHPTSHSGEVQVESPITMNGMPPA